MKSMCLLAYKPSEDGTGSLEVRAKDYHSNWMAAIAILDDDTFLGAENSYNLFTLRKNSGGLDDERARLEVCSKTYLNPMETLFETLCKP